MKSIELYERLAREAKSESCRHENADHLMPGDIGGPVSSGWSPVAFEQFRCVDCGAWLSLGPATDTYDVLVEIQLAARLAEVYTLWEPGPGRETAEMLWIAVALTNDAKHVSIPTDAEIDKVFAEAPATIREVQEQLRGVVAP